MSVTVSVLITVFNCEAHIDTAVRSVLTQDFDNHEVIVIDDGSTDGTNAVVRSISDKKLRLLEPGRLGRQAALNFGITNCRGDYIAILDADDISLPDRLSAQVAFLRGNPRYAIVGSRYRTRIDESGRLIGREDILPTAYPDILANFRNRVNVLFHSSVMFDRAMIAEIGNYDKSLPCLEDFDLYIRAATRFPIANIDRRLSLKRVHDRQYFDGRDGMHWRDEAKTAWRVIQERATLLPKSDRYDLSDPDALSWYGFE